MEVEFVACFEVIVHGLWLWNFIARLEIINNIPKSMKICYDNSTTIFFSKNDKYSKGAKHMEVKYFALKEQLLKQRVSIKHISTNLMIANPLTKGLSPKTFNEHVKRMNIIRYRYWHYVIIYICFYVFNTLSSFKYCLWYLNIQFLIIDIYVNDLYEF